MKVKPNLIDVPETMLWTLHNRAREAMRTDAILRDPDAIRIYRQIDYEFERHFGKPEGSHAARSATYDLIARDWLKAHPDGTVVSLGEGLETQCLRLRDVARRWISVDLPMAIAFRELFISPDAYHRHVARSALDRGWFAEVPRDAEVLILAQGLLMYFDEDDVRRLLTDIAAHFPGTTIAFDTVPRWFSALTCRGLKRTPHYTLPRMPWGIDKDDVAPVLRSWGFEHAELHMEMVRMPRGLPRFLAALFNRVPGLRAKIPQIIRLRVRSLPMMQTPAPVEAA